jgi:hypothetical protein
MGEVCGEAPVSACFSLRHFHPMLCLKPSLDRMRYQLDYLARIARFNRGPLEILINLLGAAPVCRLRLQLFGVHSTYYSDNLRVLLNSFELLRRHSIAS